MSRPGQRFPDSCDTFRVGLPYMTEMTGPYPVGYRKLGRPKNANYTRLEGRSMRKIQPSVALPRRPSGMIGFLFLSQR